jgi:putative transposase
LAVLAGTDFFAVEVLTLRGLVTYYVLFFIHLESRKVDIAGITVHPDQGWMQQMARNATMKGCGTLRDCRYLLHDRDTKYTHSFQAIMESGQVKTLPLPARSPNLNAYAERWVRPVKARIYAPRCARALGIDFPPTLRALADQSLGSLGLGHQA